MLLLHGRARIHRGNSGKLILAFGSGLVFPLGLAPFHLWPMALLALLVVHQLLLRTNRLSHIVGLCFLFAIGKFGAGAYWIFVSLSSYSDIHVSLAIGLFVVFLLLSGVFFSILSLFVAKSQSVVINSLVFAAGISVVEILFSLPWALSFPWLHVGYSLIDTPLSVFAPIGGVWAISFVGTFTAAAIGYLIFGRWQAFAVAVALWCPGVLLPSSNLDKHETMNVGLVQGNVPLADKWKAGGWQQSLSKYLRLSREAASADLVIWPESAVPTDVSLHEEYLLDVTDGLRGRLIFGALETRRFGGQRGTFNVVVAVGQDRLSYFRKERLVPFGEYIPMRSVFGEILQPLGYPMSSITPYAVDQAALDVTGLDLGTVICYEVAYPQLVRRRAAEAKLIVVLSEDSWLGNTIGPWQHLQIAQMRALELNRPLVRATNDGVTALIDANGSITHQLARYSEGTLLGAVTLNGSTTFYERLGLLPITVLIVSVLLLHAISRRRKSP